FFVDLEGHKEDQHVKRAIEELKERAKMVRILGSYPSALRV
ncbi:MAG TPA: prephenate dehydratase, partial [Aquifex sp.]|nr:prephenate dehydratase [Aquifex sp.]